MDAERCPHRDERLELPGFAPDEGVDQLLDVGGEGGSAWVALRESVEHIHVRRMLLRSRLVRVRAP
jgi:hypothetical protein